MSTKRNTKKFRKKLRRKNSSNGFNNNSKNTSNFTVFDLNSFDKKIKEYSKNVSTDYEIIDDKLNLTRRFPSMGKVKVIITKTNRGYSYEDVGMFKRNFTDLDNMIWEFELPKSLKEVIRSLPEIDNSKDSFISESMKDILEESSKPFMDYLKQEEIVY